MVRTAREQEVQTQSFSKNDLLDSSGVWKQPLSIYEISPYKMAPRVFNGIISLFGSSVKSWRSLRAAHFTLCIDSDVQKQHRTVPIKQPWASLSPGGKLFSSGEKTFGSCATTSQNIWPNWSSGRELSDLVVNNNFWLLLRLTSKPQRMKGLNMLCCVWLCSREAELGGNGGGFGGMCMSVRPRRKLMGEGEGAKQGWWPQPRLEVELCDRSLSARVRGLAVDALAVAFHLGQVLIEDLARSQRWHQVVKLAAVVLPVCLRFPGLSLLLPLLFQLVTHK